MRLLRPPPPPGLAPTAGLALTARTADNGATARPAITAGRAELAARLLGAAHAVRGAFDESSLDAPQARAAARDTLGPAAFDAAYRSAADSTYQTALELAHAALSSPESRFSVRTSELQRDRGQQGALRDLYRTQ